MKHFVTALLCGFFMLGPHAFSAVNARNGITVSTSSTINGKTPNSAINGQTLAGGITPAWVYNIVSGDATSDETIESSFTYGAPIVADQTGSCTKVSFRARYQFQAGDSIRIGLFTSSGTLLSNGSFTTTGYNENIDIEVTLAAAQSVTASTTYWVLYAAPAAAASAGYKSGEASGTGKTDYSNGYSTFPLSSYSPSDRTARFRVGMYIQ